MIGEGFVFLLNLDAERELAGTAADPFRSLEDRPELGVALADLVAGAHVLGRSDQRTRRAAGLRARAWLPTPRAFAALEEAGARVDPAPSLDVLRRVNGRAFSMEDLPPASDPYACARFAATADEARTTLATPSPTGRWLLKQPFGFAGRGRLTVTELDDRAMRFVTGSIASQGGVAIEPLFERELDVALHGFVDANGTVTLGEPTVANVSAGGVHLGTRRTREDELSPTERAALSDCGQATAVRLSAGGYFGPFGIDGFRYRLDGAVGFVPRCEINARYTMGWAVGMGANRPDLGESKG